MDERNIQIKTLKLHVEIEELSTKFNNCQNPPLNMIVNMTRDYSSNLLEITIFPIVFTFRADFAEMFLHQRCNSLLFIVRINSCTMK